MRSNLALALYYAKASKYSMNALLGALEADPRLADLAVYRLRTEKELVEGLAPILNDHARVIVGVSFCTAALFEIERLAGRIRQRYGARPLLLAGGPHPTGDPAGTLAMGFDAVVRGEAEETFGEALRRIDAGEDFRTVEGVAALDGEGALRFTPRTRPVDLDAFPPFSLRHQAVGPIEITRGCPFACAYCQTTHLFGARVRHRSVEAICESARRLRAARFRSVRFVTPNAFAYGSPDGRRLNLAALEALLASLARIVKPGGTLALGCFPSEVRPEHVTSETLALVRRYADNESLIIGAQSGSQRILDACRRQHTVEDVYRAVELTRAAGLGANVDFIFGLPGEEEDDMAATLRAIEDLAGLGARIHAHTFLPLPQTAFAAALPRPIPPAIRRAIDRMAGRGLLYGSWRQQEALGRRFAARQCPKNEIGFVV